MESAGDGLMSLFSTLPANPAQLAIYFSEQGTPVFPCQPSSKRPFRFDKLGFVHGFHDATTDRSKIEGAWMIAPAAMVGLPTGEISGWWVLDIDAKHCDPEEALAELEAHYGAFSTLVVKTPSGGFHVYFQWTPDSAGLSIFETEELPNGVTVDLRGNGGYAIAPGSRSHTGAYQVWIDRDIAAAPAELVTDMTALCNRSATFRVVGGTTSLKYQRTVRDLAEHIRNNQDWHKSQRELIAKWTAAYGVPPDEWVKLAPLFQQDGYSLEQTIKEMQVAVASGVMGMEKFDDEVRSSVHDLGEVSAQLGRVIDQVNVLAPKFAAVGGGMAAQSEGARQISEAMAQLSESAGQTADSLRESTQAIAQLNDAARGLQHELGRFGAL